MTELFKWPKYTTWVFRGFGYDLVTEGTELIGSLSRSWTVLVCFGILSSPKPFPLSDICRLNLLPKYLQIRKNLQLQCENTKCSTWATLSSKTTTRYFYVNVNILSYTFNIELSINNNVRLINIITSLLDVYASTCLQNKPQILHESISFKYHLYLLPCKIWKL